MKVQTKTKPQEIIIQVCDRVVIELTGEEARNLYHGLQDAQWQAADKLWDELNGLFGAGGEFK